MAAGGSMLLENIFFRVLFLMGELNPCQPKVIDASDKRFE
jgi:hypothetical protein